jgi:hypothetical protein
MITLESFKATFSYSEHARERLKQRAIHYLEVLDALNNGTYYTTPQGKTFVRYKLLTLVVKQTYIVTAYRQPDTVFYSTIKKEEAIRDEKININR